MMRQRGVSGPLGGIQVAYPEELREREASSSWPKFVTLVMTDRLGFRYERVAGLNNYVSQREAALLLRVPVMRVNRWVRAGKLKGKKRRGSSVVRLRDVLAIAVEHHIKLPMGKATTILTSSDDPDSQPQRDKVRVVASKP